MVVLEIVSVVYILFVILWAFKLVIESFDKELLTYYQQRSVKKSFSLEHAVLSNDTKIEALENELDLWWDATKKMHTYGIEIPPEHKAEFTRITCEINMLLQKSIVKTLNNYKKVDD